ncbi:hypothetical protein HNY42_08155 [Exiguobacterium sp. Helios]|uniref:hypothetical protein n=1 Tax=Exiguobacterium sp. Helios TaxID=2735868 RepID=UPI00165E2DB6|nr:hypothetical protein [Exiguobacterium sp. Helios]QNR20907.1 hypothetical protein HNY42_08155 [Exiguobacterium sp. Helios]
MQKLLIIPLLFSLAGCMSLDMKPSSQSVETGYTGSVKDGFVFEYKLTNTGDYPVKVASRAGHLLNVKVRKHGSQKVVYDSYEEVEPKRLSKEVQPHTTVTLKKTVKAGVIPAGVFDIDYIVRDDTGESAGGDKEIKLN